MLWTKFFFMTLELIPRVNKSSHKATYLQHPVNHSNSRLSGSNEFTTLFVTKLKKRTIKESPVGSSFNLLVHITQKSRSHRKYMYKVVFYYLYFPELFSGHVLLEITKHLVLLKCLNRKPAWA